MRVFLLFDCVPLCFCISEGRKGGRAPPFECVLATAERSGPSFLSSAASQWEGSTEIGVGACLSCLLVGLAVVLKCQEHLEEARTWKNDRIR